ncbi:MAG: cobalamin biosynthesis protein CobD [Nitrospirae bacterium]|nr:cobalamin biosynthesis protein CobD [Nitrospirota bacterium]
MTASGKNGRRPLTAIITCSVFVSALLLSSALLPSVFRLSSLSLLTGILFIYLTSTTIAIRELINSARIVIREVKNKNIENARNNLSMIVGRDTQNLSEEGVLKATIETLSENLSDGVIAPLFYLALGGLPFAMAYKAINTLDSMVGYKNDRYKNFGWAAARLDDIANYIPARITGMLIAFSSAVAFRSPFIVHSSLKTMFRDGRKHTSPNAGIPEAAMSGALGVRLGGPSAYCGIIVQKPYIGTETEVDYLAASEKTIKVVMFSSVAGIAISAVVLYARGIYG